MPQIMNLLKPSEQSTKSLNLVAIAPENVPLEIRCCLEELEKIISRLNVVQKASVIDLGFEALPDIACRRLVRILHCLYRSSTI